MILMYHKVAPDHPTLWWVDADAFYRQMLQLRGRRVVSLDDYDPADPRQVVITFDGVYRNVLTFAAPTLAELGYPFELFVSGNYVGGDNAFDTIEPRAEFAGEDELAALVALGGRLQWHGNAHLDLGRIDDVAAIEAELSIPDRLRRLDPRGFRWFAYPHGTFNERTVQAVRERFAGALSCNQGNDTDRYRLNRLTVTRDTRLGQARISVIIPCFNYGAFLVEAVESVLRQTYPPDEILISDDASTDDTPLVMETLARRFGDRLRLNRNATRLGIVDHFNKAVAMTSGDYVCFLGADNRFRSDFLARTAGALDRDPGAAVAYTDFALFGPRAAVVAAEIGKTWPVEVRGDEYHVVRFPEFSEESRAWLLERGNFIHGSSLFRRRAFVEAGGYVASERPEDWSLFQRMVGTAGSAVRCGEPLLEYRQHSREQANIRLNSEVELHHYRETCRSQQQEIARLRAEMALMRRRVAGPLWILWKALKTVAQRLRGG